MKKKAQTPPPELEPLIREYAAAYPGVNTFIVTTDRLVFLPRQSGEAAEHQKVLNRATRQGLEPYRFTNVRVASRHGHIKNIN